MITINNGLSHAVLLDRNCPDVRNTAVLVKIVEANLTTRIPPQSSHIEQQLTKLQLLLPVMGLIP